MAVETKAHSGGKRGRRRRDRSPGDPGHDLGISGKDTSLREIVSYLFLYLYIVYCPGIWGPGHPLTRFRDLQKEFLQHPYPLSMKKISKGKGSCKCGDKALHRHSNEGDIAWVLGVLQCPGGKNNVVIFSEPPKFRQTSEIDFFKIFFPLN